MTPKYFNESDANRIYALNMPEIIKEAHEYKLKNNVKSSAIDKSKIGLFLIDVQNSFTDPNGSLFVPGSVESNIRIAKFIYNNVEELSTIYASLDTHFTFQIFTPLWWKNSEGMHPDPFTIISYDDIKLGKWMALKDPVGSANYIKKLEADGKKNLCIWPMHTLMGDVSSAINSMVHSAMKFQEIVKTSIIHYEQKGTILNTENYSVLEPEVKVPVAGGTFNTKFFNALMSVDKLYIGGFAKSHCLLETVESLIREIGNDDVLLNKLYILEDCTDSVAPILDGSGNVIVDFPKIGNDALDRWKKLGINVVKSTDPI